MYIPNSLPLPMHPDKWETLDSTKLQSFAACPRSYFFEYILGWRPSTTSNHLVFGRAWHEALEHLYKNGFTTTHINDAFTIFLEDYRKELPESTDTWFGGKNPNSAFLALIEYSQKYASDLYDWQVLDTEVYAQVQVTEECTIIVKLDLLVQLPSGVVQVVEHKTGSRAGQSWERQWKLSIQVGSYIHACNVFYNQEQTPLLVNGTIFQKSKRDFARVLCKRTEGAMLNWTNTVAQIQERIEYNLWRLQEETPSQLAMESFPQNPTACNNYAGCPYHDLCTCVSNPLRMVEGEGIAPDGFQVFWWDPTEGKTEKKKES